MTKQNIYDGHAYLILSSNDLETAAARMTNDIKSYKDVHAIKESPDFNPGDDLHNAIYKQAVKILQHKRSTGEIKDLEESKPEEVEQPLQFAETPTPLTYGNPAYKYQELLEKDYDKLSVDDKAKYMEVKHNPILTSPIYYMSKSDIDIKEHIRTATDVEALKTKTRDGKLILEARRLLRERADK